jgi:hypothetical protein
MRRQICEAARSWLRTPALQVCDDCSDVESVTIGILMAGRNGVDPSVGSGGLEAAGGYGWAVAVSVPISAAAMTGC